MFWKKISTRQYWIAPRYYISLQMDVGQDLICITSRCIYSKPFFWKTMLVSLRQITKKLCNGMNQSSFEVILLDNVLINGHYLKNTNWCFRSKLLYARIWFLYDCLPQWSRYSKNVSFNSRMPSIFPATKHEEASYCR